MIRFEGSDRIFADGGAMEAFEDARKAGKIRYIGFTGHKHPHVHLLAGRETGRIKKLGEGT